jgi:hypothetical protein
MLPSLRRGGLLPRVGLFPPETSIAIFAFAGRLQISLFVMFEPCPFRRCIIFLRVLDDSRGIFWALEAFSATTL